MQKASKRERDTEKGEKAVQFRSQEGERKKEQKVVETVFGEKQEKIFQNFTKKKCPFPYPRSTANPKKDKEKPIQRYIILKPRDKKDKDQIAGATRKKRQSKKKQLD